VELSSNDDFINLQKVIKPQQIRRLNKEVHFMDKDRRIEKRIPCWDIIAEIELSGINQEVKITDITRRGACVNKKMDPANTANVTLCRKTPQSFYRIQEHPCQIIEHPNGPHTGLQFASRLTPDETELLGLPKK
jgi:hypothetical protein